MFGKYEGKIQFRHQNVGTNRTGAICIFLKHMKHLHAVCEVSVKLRVEVSNAVVLISAGPSDRAV